jgi:hypothetical protein
MPWTTGLLLLYLSLGWATSPAQAQRLVVSGVGSTGWATVDVYDPTTPPQFIRSYPPGGGGRLAWGPDFWKDGDGVGDLYAIQAHGDVVVFDGLRGDWGDTLINLYTGGFVDLAYHGDHWYITLPEADEVRKFTHWSDDVFLQMASPWGVTVSPEDDTLLATSTAHGKVYEFYFDGQLRRVLGAGHLIEPRGVAIGADGDIYVSDYIANKVVKIDRISGQVVDPEFITAGSEGLSGPEELVCLPDGRWYVTSETIFLSDYVVFEYYPDGSFSRGFLQAFEMQDAVGLEYTRCPDLDGDSDTDQSDLAILLPDWGCAGGNCPGDCDGDGDTDQGDLGILLLHWGCET